MADQQTHVLVIEDSDVKWRDARRVLSALSPSIEISRAPTVEDANREIANRRWRLILLDISMDIKPSATGRGAGGHDTTGGLKIAERMFYLGYDAPIIIFTAFDAFPSSGDRRGAVLGLQDVTAEASNLLGSLLIGWIRYGDPDWEEELANKAKAVLGF